MFNDSKYTKWYYKICSKKYNDEFLEKHHIIPKCLGGKDTSDNLVNLSPKAHFVCHWLLTKMVDDVKLKRKLYYAFNFMLCKPKDLKEKRYYPCSRVYEIAKKLLHKHNPSYNEEIKEKISLARKKAWQNPTKAMLEGIEKMRQSKMGKPPPNKGITGKVKASKETKELLSKQRSGRKWFNDGEKTYFIFPKNAKKNYILGRK